MPSHSPMTGGSTLTTFTLLANGSAVNGAYQIASLKVFSAINRLPHAQIELVDGSAAEGNFPISASKALAPGTALEVQLGYQGANQTVFSGVVTRQTIRKRPHGASLLQVEARDKAVKMTLARRSAIYTDTTDSSILGQLIQAHGLTAQVASTSPSLKELTQYYVSDWDFLVTRAEANGLVVAVDSGTVAVLKPDPSVSPVLSLTYGFDVYDFHLEQDAESQQQSVRCSSWDYTQQQLIEAQAKISNANAIGSPGSTVLAQVVAPSEVAYQSSAPWTQGSLKAWAQGLALRSELAKVRGELRFQGSALVKPGKTLALGGFGDRFNGTAFVSAVTHSVEDGHWTTTAEVGLEDKSFVEQVPVMGPAAGGLLPGVAGLLNGVVKQIDQDPGGNTRVLVQIPVVGMSDGIWARLATPYATQKAGHFFFPEPGDEVILGFINDDPGNPIILGSVYSSSQKAPPYPPDAQNGTKAIVTKNQLQVKFDDQNKVLTVQTPGKNMLILSDQDGGITLKDQNGNQLKMSSSGIEIQSAAKITLSAQSNVSVQASTGNIDLSASAGKVSAAGLNVALSAQVEFSAQGNAKASLQASGEASVAGALVRIN